MKGGLWARQLLSIQYSVICCRQYAKSESLECIYLVLLKLCTLWPNHSFGFYFYEFVYFPHIYIFFKLFTYLFLAALGLHCCPWAFSGCGQWGLLSGWGAQASHCVGFSRAMPRTGSRVSSVVVARGFSCLMICGIFLDQGLNQWPLHWQADS